MAPGWRWTWREPHCLCGLFGAKPECWDFLRLMGLPWLERRLLRVAQDLPWRLMAYKFLDTAGEAGWQDAELRPFRLAQEVVDRIGDLSEAELHDLRILGSLLRLPAEFVEAQIARLQVEREGLSEAEAAKLLGLTPDAFRCRTSSVRCALGWVPRRTHGCGLPSTKMGASGFVVPGGALRFPGAQMGIVLAYLRRFRRAGADIERRGRGSSRALPGATKAHNAPVPER